MQRFDPFPVTKAGAMTLAPNLNNGLLTGTTLGSISDTITYNTFGEAAIYRATFNASEVFSEQYTRDKLGRITQKTESILGQPHTYNYTYDLAGRLTGILKDNIFDIQYRYDSNGNRLSHTTTGSITANGIYDDQDRLVSYGRYTYTYTANVELITKTDTTTNGTTRHNYDLSGNLISVTLPNGTLIEYIIDGNNRRIGKKVNGILAQGFLYKDQLNPIAELDGLGNVVSRFVYGSKFNVPDYMIKGGVTYRIISDHLGSPRLVVDSVNGQIVQRIDYDEFGIVEIDTNPGFQPFGFAGGLYDQNTGLTRFGSRDYDPYSGRWITKDPILFNGGDTNLYGYVQNNPINLIDPFGLSAAEFDPNSGTITVRDSQGNELARVPAQNNTDSKSKGPIAPGTYPVGDPVSNTGNRANRTPSQGPYFIPITDVPNRTQLGIHGGRSGPSSPTLGCLRTTNEGVTTLSDINKVDPIRRITIRHRRLSENRFFV